jgi:uncharacterized protein YjbI with pentapeptide repeats
MKGLFAAVAVVAAMVGSDASAFDPADLKKLKETNECEGCDLTGAYLMKNKLIGAKLRKANLSDAFLTNADLTGADLTGTNLSKAKLHSANLGAADLTASTLKGAILNNTILCNTIMPDGRVIYSGCVSRNLCQINVPGDGNKTMFVGC